MNLPINEVPIKFGSRNEFFSFGVKGINFVDPKGVRLKSKRIASLFGLGFLFPGILT